MRGRFEDMKAHRIFRTLSMEIEVGPGSDIDNACRDLVGFADKMGLTVTAKFNDVTLMAHPGGDPDLLAANWHKEIASKKAYKIAVSYER